MCHMSVAIVTLLGTQSQKHVFLFWIKSMYLYTEKERLFNEN